MEKSDIAKKYEKRKDKTEVRDIFIWRDQAGHFVRILLGFVRSSFLQD
jgi:uncharacterized protein with gpF-like domain